MNVMEIGSQQNDWMSENHVKEYLDKYIDLHHKNIGESDDGRLLRLVCVGGLYKFTTDI